MIDEAARRSEELFKQGFYCGESVLLAIAEHYGITSELIPRIATGFCGGMSRTCGLCGAVSGGIMGINMLYGRTAPQQSVDENYRLVREFARAFEDRFGTTNCFELTGCRLDTPEGQRLFRENNFPEKCQTFTGEATRMALTLMQTPGPRDTAVT